MNRIKGRILPAVGLCFLAVAGVSLATNPQQDPSQQTVDQTDYVKHRPSGLCFAVSHADITNVPCASASGVPLPPTHSSISKQYVSEMQFRRHAQTRLCYGVHYGSITAVPCEAVAKLLPT